MKCRKRKSIGGGVDGYDVASTGLTSLGTGLMAGGALFGPAGLPAVIAGGVLSGAGAVTNLVKNNKMNKLQDVADQRAMIAQQDNIYNQADYDNGDNFIPTINFKLGGKRYYNRFSNTNIKAKRH